jgi:flagellar motor switch protein FliN/FliY
MAAPSVHDEAGEGEEEKTNQEMLMKVPLEISVEIGRTKRLVRDILEFTQGTLVVLDKMAGEQVDLFVNGQCIARGDIVVVEDNFGIRITEIVTRELNPESL